MEAFPVGRKSLPRQKMAARCRSLDHYAVSGVYQAQRSTNKGYLREVARDLKSIPVLLLLGNIFPFVLLIICPSILSYVLGHPTTTSQSGIEHVTQPIVEVIRERRRDDAIPPCSSVWDRVCTGWITASEPMYRKLILGSADLYVEDMYKDTQKTHLTMSVATRTPNAMQKAFVFYQSCIRHRMEVEGTLDELRLLFIGYSLRGWPNESFADNIISTVLLRYLHDPQDSAILDVQSANLAPRTSIIESQLRTKKTVYLALGCPSFLMHRYVYTQTKTGPVRDCCSIYMKKDVITSCSPHVGNASLEGIFAFERKQALVVRKHCYMRRFKRVTVADMTNGIRGVDWATFLNDIVGLRSSFKVLPRTEILIRSKNYLRYVASLRQGAKNVRAVNYIDRRLLHLFGRHASRELRLYEDTFREVDINMRLEQGLSKESLMLANDGMPMAVGRVYLEIRTRIMIFIKVNGMVQIILFDLHMLFEASWIVSGELLTAYAHIGAIQTMISIPLRVADDAPLTEYYNDLAMDSYNAPFLGLLVNATRHIAKKRFTYLDVQEDIISGTDEERKTAQESRAAISIKHLHYLFPDRIVDLNLHRCNPRQSVVYDVVDNVTVPPAGILQPPYYDPDVPYALNYCGLGGLLLHDIITEFFRLYFNIANNDWMVKLKCINSGVYPEKEDNTCALSERRNVFTVTSTMTIDRVACHAYHYYMDAEDDQVISGAWPAANADQMLFLSAVRTVCSLRRDRHWARLMQADMTESQIPLLEKIKHVFQGLSELYDAFHCSRNEKDELCACMEDKPVMEESPAT
ncbi:membrane metallo-endopeptidase-like 1 [Ornithodoros turicata]|uniref:membrane metallo-endopeptidase-like 1 n=1 Tax=Ornithodoros turicata TaxID=34597 RepID=UPI0031398566